MDNPKEMADPKPSIENKENDDQKSTADCNTASNIAVAQSDVAMEESSSDEKKESPTQESSQIDDSQASSSQMVTDTDKETHGAKKHALSDEPRTSTDSGDSTAPPKPKKQKRAAPNDPYEHDQEIVLEPCSNVMSIRIDRSNVESEGHTERPDCSRGRRRRRAAGRHISWCPIAGQSVSGDAANGEDHDGENGNAENPHEHGGQGDQPGGGGDDNQDEDDSEDEDDDDEEEEDEEEDDDDDDDEESNDEEEDDSDDDDSDTEGQGAGDQNPPVENVEQVAADEAVDPQVGAGEGAENAPEESTAAKGEGGHIGDTKLPKQDDEPATKAQGEDADEPNDPVQAEDADIFQQQAHPIEVEAVVHAEQQNNANQVENNGDQGQNNGDQGQNNGDQGQNNGDQGQNNGDQDQNNADQGQNNADQGQNNGDHVQNNEGQNEQNNDEPEPEPEINVEFIDMGGAGDAGIDQLMGGDQEDPPEGGQDEEGSTDDEMEEFHMVDEAGDAPADLVIGAPEPEEPEDDLMGPDPEAPLMGPDPEALLMGPVPEAPLMGPVPEAPLMGPVPEPPFMGPFPEPPLMGPPHDADDNDSIDWNDSDDEEETDDEEEEEEDEPHQVGEHGEPGDGPPPPNMGGDPEADGGANAPEQGGGANPPAQDPPLDPALVGGGIGAGDAPPADDAHQLDSKINESNSSHLDHVKNGAINHEFATKQNNTNTSTKDTNCVSEDKNSDQVSPLDSEMPNPELKINNPANKQSAESITEQSSQDAELTKLLPAYGIKDENHSRPDSPNSVKSNPDAFLESSDCSQKLCEEVVVKKLNCDAVILSCNITIDSNEVSSDCSIKISDSVVDVKITHAVDNLVKDEPLSTDNPTIDEKVSISEAIMKSDAETISTTVEPIQTEAQCAEKSQSDENSVSSVNREEVETLLPQDSVKNENASITREAVKEENSTLSNVVLETEAVKVEEPYTSTSSDVECKVETQTIKDFGVGEKLPSNDEPINIENKIVENILSDDETSTPESKNGSDEPNDCDVLKVEENNSKVESETEMPSIKGVTVEESITGEVCSVDEDTTVESEEQTTDKKASEDDTKITEEFTSSDNKTSIRDLETVSNDKSADEKSTYEVEESTSSDNKTSTGGLETPSNDKASEDDTKITEEFSSSDNKTSIRDLETVSNDKSADEKFTNEVEESTSSDNKTSKRDLETVSNDKSADEVPLEKSTNEVEESTSSDNKTSTGGLETPSNDKASEDDTKITEESTSSDNKTSIRDLETVSNDKSADEKSTNEVEESTSSDNKTSTGGLETASNDKIGDEAPLEKSTNEVEESTSSDNKTSTGGLETASNDKSADEVTSEYSVEKSTTSDNKTIAKDLEINSNQLTTINDSTVEPTDSTVEPTDSNVEPTDSTVEPTDSNVITEDNFENNLQSSCSTNADVTNTSGPDQEATCDQSPQNVEADKFNKHETNPQESTDELNHTEQMMSDVLNTDKSPSSGNVDDKKCDETVEDSKDLTKTTDQEGDETAALKSDDNGEDLRQPIVNLEKLQSPLAERSSVSLATCELCGGACPTQQCLRLRRNSVTGRVTRRGRGRPRSNENVSTTENASYTCLLCRKVMQDRESGRKHVQTSHALKEHKTHDKYASDEITEEDASKDAGEWKLPKRTSKSLDLLGTLFASDNDDDSPSDDEDSDFTCDDHEIEEAEKDEDLDLKKSESRRKSLRNFRTARTGKQDDTLTVGKRSFRLSKNSTIQKSVAGSKSFAQRNKCIGNLESTVALTKRGTPIPLRVLRKSLLENNGNLAAFGRGRNAAGIGSSVLVTCSSSKDSNLSSIDNDSQSKDPSFDDDTISLRSGNSISRGENCVSLRSSMRISSKSNDDDEEDDDVCDNVGSNSELNQSGSQQAGRVKCDHCGSTYSTKSNLQRHIANHCRALNGVDKDSRKKKADDLKRKKLRKYYNTGAGTSKRTRRAGSSSLEEEFESSDNEYSDQGSSSKTQRDKGTSTTGLVYSPRLILHRIDNGKIDSLNADKKPENEEIVSVSETDKSIQVGQGECNIRSAKNFRCTDCRRSFYTQDDLSLHGMIHANRTDFPCPRCNKVFPTFPNLRVHMRTHATGPPCLCDVCGKAFNTPSSLKVHMKTHDEDEKFNCSYCNRTFNFVGNLKVHERLHTGEKPYKCSLCERCFTQSTSLKLHVQSLHMQQRIPLPCDKCCRKFRSQETLERHKLCHVDYRRYKCDICDSVSFNNRAGLKHHMETKHMCTSDGTVVDLIESKPTIDSMNPESGIVQRLNVTPNQNCVTKLPSISVLGVKSSISSGVDSGLSSLQNLVQSARFNPHAGSTTNLPKSTSGPENHQFCMNGHNLSITPRECNDYCKVSVLNQGGFNADANASATSDNCNFNNSTPIKNERLDTSSDLSSGNVCDNRNNLIVNKTGFGNISPINSSTSGIKNNICHPHYNVAMSSRGGIGRGGRGSRGGRGRGGGSFNFQNLQVHKCGACSASFDKKVTLRRHIKETHSGPFGDVNETIMQLQNDLEDLQRIYGNKKVENNRRGTGRRKSTEGRKQSIDLESSFDDSAANKEHNQFPSEGNPQTSTFNDSNKPETTFTSSFNVESLLSKSPGDGDARTGSGVGAGGDSSVESGEGAFAQPNQAKSNELDSSSNADNYNELEGCNDESGKSGKSRTKYEFGCHLCDKSFPTTMGLVRHKNFVHKVPSEKCRLPMRDKPFECEYCTKRFTFETGAQKHIQRHIEKGHSKRVKKEKVIRKPPSASQLNYPSTSAVNSSSYSAPPSVDSTFAASSAQGQAQHMVSAPPDSRSDISDLNRPTSLPSFKWNDYRIAPDVTRSPLVNPDTNTLAINQNHVYDPYHNNPNSWAAMNHKPNFYKNHTYDKTIYPIPTSSTLHNEFGYVSNETFSKPLPTLFSHNNANLYPGATSYSEPAASKSSVPAFSVPASYNDVTSSTYAQSTQPAQASSTSTYVTQEFMPKPSTENDYTYSSSAYVGSNHQASYSGEKQPEPSAAFNDNQTANYFKTDSDFSNAPPSSYETKSAPTFEPKIPQNVGGDQFIFNNATDDSSYMKNAFHAAHLLDASNYEKTYYNLDSNKFKNDAAYNQPESSYSLTRLDGYATSPTPSVSKPASPYYDAQLLPPAPAKHEHFVNYYKSYQYPEMPPAAGQMDRTDTNTDRNYGANEWGGMMYNNL